MVGNILTDLNAAINFCLALVMGVCSLWLWEHDKTSKIRWLDFLESAIGLYFAGMYIFVLLTPAHQYDSVFFGQAFVRPALMLLFGVNAASSLMRVRLRKEYEP